MSLRIALLGYGKMGKAVEAEAIPRGHTIAARLDTHSTDADWSGIHPGTVDVVIEFSHPDAALANYRKVLQRGLPIVTGTTGWHSQLAEVEALVAAQHGSFLHSSNFSPGVNILFHLNRVLARLMNTQPGYDAYVEEAHHRHKKDAPSGTAISLLQGMIDGLDHKERWAFGELQHRAPMPEEIAVAVTRAGEIVGKHSVAYRSEIDEIRITHEAFNRRGFALGAVLAAEWLQGRKGMWTAADVFAG